METKNHLEGVASFFDQAIKEIANGNLSYKILDFGCGSGQLVRDLGAFGYTIYGCDVLSNDDNQSGKGLLKKIETQPYKLPFADNEFDVVISTFVLEHAQNTKECFHEIARVLKPGGYSLHLLPGKYYLPIEPHIYVPLVNWFWPKCPDWWLALWAYLGIRNGFQKDLSWKETYMINKSYCKEGLCYRSTKYYESLSREVFGHFFWPMIFYINHANGGFCRLARNLPFKGFLGKISRDLRMGFLVTQKIKD